MLDPAHDLLERTQLPKKYRFVSIQRINKLSLLTIFRKFITDELIQKIFNNIDPSALILNKARNWILKPTLSDILIALAITIRIYGLQNKAHADVGNDRPLRTAIVEAITHFEDTIIGIKIPGLDQLTRLITLPLFTSEYYQDISTNFQSVIDRLGERCAGDEKLFHFTGDSPNIRHVPTKPGAVGFWLYQLSVPLQNNHSYLLLTKLHENREKQTVASVVSTWVEVVQRLGYPGTLLTFDSYYMSNESRNILHASNVKYVGAFRSNIFADYTKVCLDYVKKKGQWVGFYNPTTHHSIIHYYHEDENLGRKYVMSNACTLEKVRSAGNSVPLFDLYGATFNVCDKYNQQLHNHTWPLRKGGFQRGGEKGTQHNYIFSCILQNTFNLYSEVMGEDYQEQNFRTNCVNLADQLCRYAHHLSRGR